ncbi:MAG: Bax inhibitor-1 family protein [Clostridia bacterium]|nr:Bax inhibitor-1 family protein [Clostridia bacterium]
MSGNNTAPRIEESESRGMLEKRKQQRMEMIPDKEIGSRKYNLVIGIVIAWGFFVNFATVSLIGTPEFIQTAPVVLIVFGYLVSATVGVIMSAKSSNPLISFIGYNLVVLPVGVLLALFLPMVPIEIIGKAFCLTGLITIGMMAISIAFPDTFLGMGKTLFISLLVGIIVEAISLLLGYRGELFDYAFVGIFALYIGYDWAKAQAYPKTVDNAVDSALDLYLDVINLFVRLISIMSKRS